MNAMPISKPRAAIFLAAGQGSRLRPLTENTPKCLLTVQGQTILDTLLPYALLNQDREIVVVGGFCSDRLSDHLARHYPHTNIRLIENTDYASDVNILSVDKGVSALAWPERGYTIIETDLLLDPVAWSVIHNAENSTDSFWVTRGRYSATLTGGIVHAPHNHQIDGIAYVPKYDPAYDGWHKMVGILSVAPAQVSADKAHRKTAMQNGLMQYYMAPWIDYAQTLPCVAVDLGSLFCRSFNTASEYQNAVREYSQLVKGSQHEN